MSRFDKVIDRKNTDAIKYTALEKYFGTKDVQPLWVADMDFPVGGFVKKDLKARVDKTIYGYEELGDKFYSSIINWMKKRHKWDVEKQWINYIPGVVSALSSCVEAFSDEGDEVIVQTPVYYPFFSVVKEQNRKLILNPLREKDGDYKFDLKDLKSKITKKTKMLILCSPHNPVGRVWKKKELEKLARICLENNIVIVSDEVHSDLVFKKFTPMAKISKKIANITVTLNAPSKTFNLASLTTSYSITSNTALREKFTNVLQRRAITLPNAFGLASLVSVYTKGENWLEEILEYLKGNFKLVEKTFRNTKVKVIKLEGTYLVWLDFRKFEMTQKKLEEIFLYRAKVALHNGMIFGKDGKGFFRINIALPRKELRKALEKITKALDEI
ncbi:MAG: PatB family C-S lyase [Campylobacterales bacterium]|nr:PatB family C-S lyase [Campylobacterales bacterium]